MRKILMATDGSEHSFRAIDEVAMLAKAIPVEVTVLSVAQEIIVYGDFESIYVSNENIRLAAEEVLLKAKEAFKAKGLEVGTVLGKGNPAEVINDTAEAGGYDLIVMGSRGLGGINRLLLGSVSGRVANTAKVSVLVVK